MPVQQPSPTKAAGTSNARSSLAFVVDSESSIRQFISLILQGHSIDTIEFTDGAQLPRSAACRARPTWSSSTSISRCMTPARSVEALGKTDYAGAVQLISNRGSAVLDTVKQAGEQLQTRDAAAAEEAVRDLGDPEDHLRRSSSGNRPIAGDQGRARRGAQATTGSSSGTSRRSTCAGSSLPAPRPSRASATRNTASCCPAASCRAPTKQRC